MRASTLIAAICALLAPGIAQAQMLMDGHRGVCSDCHVGAATDRYVLDTENSMVVYALDVFGFSKTIGTFREIGGGFVFDPEDAENASVIASIDAASVDMSDPALNRLVRSERFLDAQAHPLITFQSTAVERIDATHLRIDGQVSLRGIAKPVSLAVEINKLGPHPLTGRRTAGIIATGRLQRSEFGLTLGLPSIGDEIEFTLYAQGTLLE